MKALVFLLFTLGLSLLTEPAYKNNLDINDGNIKVVFDNTLNINDLAAIKMEMAKRDVKITYNHMNFDSKGKLQSIEYEAEAKNSQSVETFDLITPTGNQIIIGKL